MDKFIAKIDKVIKTETLQDIELKLTINESKVISNIIFNTTIEGIEISVNIDLDDLEESFESIANIKLSNKDTYLALDLISSVEEKKDSEISRENTLIFSTSYDDKIELQLNETYNTKTNDYNNKIDFNIDSALENFSAGYDLQGKYKIEKELERLDINNLNLDIKTDFYKFYFDFNGYVQQKNTDLIEEINLDNVVFIDNMLNEQINDIKSEIYKNGKEFLDLFGKGKW